MQRQRTIFVLLSAAARVPIIVLESAVITRTFSAQLSDTRAFCKLRCGNGHQQVEVHGDLLLRYPPRVAIAISVQGKMQKKLGQNSTEGGIDRMGSMVGRLDKAATLWMVTEVDLLL